MKRRNLRQFDSISEVPIISSRWKLQSWRWSHCRASLESSLIARQAKTITHRAYERDCVEVDDKELCQPLPAFHYRLTSTQSVTSYCGIDCCTRSMWNWILSNFYWWWGETWNNENSSKKMLSPAKWFRHRTEGSRHPLQCFRRHENLISKSPFKRQWKLVKMFCYIVKWKVKCKPNNEQLGEKSSALDLNWEVFWNRWCSMNEVEIVA